MPDMLQTAIAWKPTTRCVMLFCFNVSSQPAPLRLVKDTLCDGFAVQHFSFLTDTPTLYYHIASSVPRRDEFAATLEPLKGLKNMAQQSHEI